VDNGDSSVGVEACFWLIVISGGMAIAIAMAARPIVNLIGIGNWEMNLIIAVALG